MKNISKIPILLCMTLLFFGSCSPDDVSDLIGLDKGETIDGRSNADVMITNETTGVVWHGDSEGIVQSTDITIGGSSDDSSFDLIAHEGDILRMTYSPYPHFAEKHSVNMTVRFDGVETIVVTHAPYEAKLHIGTDVSKGIRILTIIGVSGNKGDKCYLNERRSVRVKVE